VARIQHHRFLLAVALSLSLFGQASRAEGPERNGKAQPQPKSPLTQTEPSAVRAMDPEIEAARVALRAELRRLGDEIDSLASRYAASEIVAASSVSRHQTGAINSLDNLVASDGTVKAEVADELHRGIASLRSGLDSVKSALAKAHLHEGDREVGTLLQRLDAMQNAFAIRRELWTPEKREAAWLAAERKAQEERERRAKEEADQRAKEEAGRSRREAERQLGDTREIVSEAEPSRDQALRQSPAAERKARRDAEHRREDRTKAAKSAGRVAYDVWANERRLGGNTNIRLREMTYGLTNKLASLVKEPSDANLQSVRDAFSQIDTHLTNRMASGATRPREDADLNRLRADFRDLYSAFEGALHKTDHAR
jgi:hypothetical protein